MPLYPFVVLDHPCRDPHGGDVIRDILEHARPGADAPGLASLLGKFPLPSELLANKLQELSNGNEGIVTDRAFSTSLISF